MNDTLTLRSLADDRLTARLYELRKSERQLHVEFLAYLAEVDRRRLYLAQGYSSLFAFATDWLGYTRSAAFRRITAARLVARFPALAAALADGRLCLTTLCELRDVLDEDNLEEVVGRAAGRTEEDVRALVAALRPQPAPADLLRRLPERREAPEATPGLAPALAPAPGLARAPTLDPAPTTDPAAAAASAAEAVPAAAAAAAAAPSRSTSRLEPISSSDYVLRVTVSREFVADLEAIRSLVSHQHPNASLGELLHHALRVARAAGERRRSGAGRAAQQAATGATPTDEPSAVPPSKGRYVPAAVRAEVWGRDTGRCTFIGRDGHPCGSTHLVQVHHREPHARGGPATVANLTLRCAAHNRYDAERDFGAAQVRQKIADAQADLF